MAIIRGQMWGDVSGKVGGVVFTRNGTGKTIRAYVKGIDAKSIQQINNRGAFSSIVSLWKTLPYSSKQQWNTFANTIYVPRKGRVQSRYSGYSAYCGINLDLYSHCATNYVTTLVYPSCSYTYTGYTNYMNLPPVAPLTSNICKNDGSSLAISFNSFSIVKSSGLCSLKIDFLGGAQALHPYFQTPVYNHQVGFACYMSEPFSLGGMTVANKEAYLIGSIGSPNIISGWSSSSYVTFSWSIDPAYWPKLKKSFIAGNQVFISLYQCGYDGMAVFVDRKLITIS